MFQTLNKQVSGANSTEELHYQYDTSGRLSNAAFAQTPETGYTDYSDPAATRARAYYEYDPAGRITELDHYWDTYTLPQGASSGYYDSVNILANECHYEGTRGLKDHSKFYTGSGTATWTQVRDEEYGYDSDLDYLVSADYGDGLSNATVSWTYDAAGNRASDSSNTGTWSYDALDRMTASPGVSYSNDILGNRTAKGSSISYGWDELNRMTSYTSGSTTTNYVYRADGMRVSKSDGTNSTAFYYDGQMPVEMKDVTSSGSAVTCQVPGARGLDWMQKTAGAGTVVAYPVYDAHGNMIATLSRSGSASYAVNDQRSYDAWGGIRSGNTTGDPKHQHCANLGHVADDESGLVYMRARFYETSSGRFLSEDDQRSGRNYYIYASNSPLGRADTSGHADDATKTICWILLIIQAVNYVQAGIALSKISNAARMIFAAGTVFLLAWLLQGDGVPKRTNNLATDALNFGIGFAIYSIFGIGVASLNLFVGAPVFKGFASEALGAVEAYANVLQMFCNIEAVEEAYSSNQKVEIMCSFCCVCSSMLRA